MAHFFITRPIFAIVLSIVIVFLGGVAILVLPVAQFPPISPPLIQVQTTYIGASASVVEQSVASEIENEVVGVDNLIYMQSTSSSSGQYTLNCTFKVGADIQKALIDVQNRVRRRGGKLPKSVNRFGITVQKKSPQILMVVALVLADQLLRPALPEQLHDAQRDQSAAFRSRASAARASSATRTTRCALGSARTGWPNSDLQASDLQTPSTSRTY